MRGLFLRLPAATHGGASRGSHWPAPLACPPPPPRDTPVDGTDKGRDDAYVFKGADRGEDSPHPRRWPAFVGLFGKAHCQDFSHSQIPALPHLDSHQLTDG